LYCGHMPTKTDSAKDHKEGVADRFNVIGANHDSPQLSIFPTCAERLVALANIKSGDTVLDVGSGTGAVALRAAAAAGGTGRVIGIDIASSMLERARRNMEQAGLTNVQLLEMDGEQPDFPAATFDAVLCGFGIQ